MARPGRPKTDAKYEHLTIRCPEGLLDQWREAAKEHDRSLNAEIVRALRQATRYHGPRRHPAPS